MNGRTRLAGIVAFLTITMSKPVAGRAATQREGGRAGRPSDRARARRASAEVSGSGEEGDRGRVDGV